MEELKHYEKDWQKEAEFLKESNSILREKNEILEKWKDQLWTQTQKLFDVVTEKNDTIKTLRIRSFFLAEVLRKIEDGEDIHTARIHAAQSMGIEPIEWRD